MRSLETIRRTVRDAIAARRAPRTRSFRLERFGGIIQLSAPRALVFVDRSLARRIGAHGGALWSDPRDDGAIGRHPLSAPLEAHLQLTNRCEAGCTGCYTGATPGGTLHEWDLTRWQRAIDALADAGVFHVALGGGESASLPWLGRLAAYARERGVVPNLTTSGLVDLDHILPHAHLFGQINVSVDAVGAGYAAVRGHDGFARADAAVQRLRAATRRVGINAVVTRRTYAQLDTLFAYARHRRLREVELLRFKPSGRGRGQFATMTCTDAQHRRLLPDVLAACRRHRVRARLDCSFTPMIACHAPAPEVLAQLAVYGCAGGDLLVAATATGTLTGCSFAAPPPGRPRVDTLAAYWDQPGAFGHFRAWRDTAEPCASGPYLTLCRGGCAAVAAHLCGDPHAPDPQCPRVIDAARAGASCGRVPRA